MQTKDQFLLSKMCKATATGSGLCDEVDMLLVYSIYAMQCQRQGRWVSWGGVTTVYFIPDGKCSVTGYSIYSSRRGNVIFTLKKAKIRPSKRVVGVEVWLHSFLTSTPYRSPYARVSQSQDCPFGLNNIIEPHNVTGTSDNNSS